MVSEYSAVELEIVANGVILPVKAKPAARKNAVNGVFDGALKVSVTTAPENGKANKSIIKLLSKTFGISPKYIALISGELSSNKKFLFESSSEDAIKGILATL